MAVSFRLPRLGANMDEATVIAWLKHVGDAVQTGEPLVEIDTDKAVQELPAPAEGVLLQITVAAGERVPVGAELGLIGAPEDQPVAPAAGQPPGDEPAGAPQAPPRAPASPAARRRARELGVDLSRVIGTGPGGRISLADIEAAAASPGDGAASAPAPAPGAPQREQGLSPLRAQIARQMTRSAREIPQFSVTSTVDVSPVLAFREMLRGFGVQDQAMQLSFTDFLIQATARTLVDFPDLNASVVAGADGTVERVIRHPQVNLGLATDTPAGLLVPVLSGAESLSLAAIAAGRRALADRARSGRVRAGDLEGSTFTISNLGPFGVDSFTALVNPPEVGILAVGSIRAGRCAFTVSADHRAVDGAMVARFLGALARWFEGAQRWVLA